MNAIISVYNKTGVAAFAKALHEGGIALIATDGTARELEKSGVPVTKVADFTGSPELLGGQVKTLHPRIHAAIATGEIGMVVVNLIPPGDGTGKTLAKMDIGGVALIRSGIKNFKNVIVIVSPLRYGKIIEDIRREGHVAQKNKLRLAKDALKYLRSYDAKIYKILATME